MISRRALFAAAIFAITPPALAAGGGGEATREQQRLTSAETYVPFPTFSTAVIANGRARGTLVIDVGVDVPDAALRSRVTSLTPRLTDSLRTAIATYSSTYYRDRTAPDPATLSRLMQVAVDRTLGRTGARLLLANVVYQHRQG
ncbi:MAG: hypothetical protein ABW199_02310 [Caulobacterales bacterium]